MRPLFIFMCNNLTKKETLIKRIEEFITQENLSCNQKKPEALNMDIVEKNDQLIIKRIETAPFGTNTYILTCIKI